MTKYHKLTEYLQGSDADAFMTNFAALEDILGFALPASARQYPAWWANQGKGQSLAWESVGWKTSDVSLGIETVNFIRTKADVTDEPRVPKLSIAEAKAGLARNFDVAPEAIEIVIKG